MALRALLIDDHDIFRDGLRSLLQLHAKVHEFREAKCLADAVDCIASWSPDIVTIDLDLPDAFGIGAVARLRALAPEAKHLVVSATEDSGSILSAIAAGAHGYVPKRLAGVDAGQAVREILDGRVYVPASIHTPAQRLPEPTLAVGDLSKLSQRQRDVARALATGATTKVIAYDLKLSEGTVKLHLSAIYRILGCNNRAQAVGLLSRIDPRALRDA